MLGHPPSSSVGSASQSSRSGLSCRIVSLLDMLSLYADKFVDAVDYLASLGQYLEDRGDRRWKVLEEARLRAIFLRDRLVELELRVSAKAMWLQAISAMCING